MSKRLKKPSTGQRVSVAAKRLGQVAMAACRSALGALCCTLRRRGVPVEVVLIDGSRRRLLKKEIARSVRRLRRVIGDQAPTVAILVQQVIVEQDRQLAGCCQVCQRSDGSRWALIRLALQVNGRRLSMDELLATLAGQYVGLAFGAGGKRTLLVPVDFQPSASATDRVELPPDPLTRPDSEQPGAQAA